MMDNLHSCRVEKREGGQVFLASISGRYFFWMNENNEDTHWGYSMTPDKDQNVETPFIYFMKGIETRP